MQASTARKLRTKSSLGMETGAPRRLPCRVGCVCGVVGRSGVGKKIIKIGWCCHALLLLDGAAFNLFCRRNRLLWRGAVVSFLLWSAAFPPWVLPFPHCFRWCCFQIRLLLGGASVPPFAWSLPPCSFLVVVRFPLSPFGWGCFCWATSATQRRGRKATPPIKLFSSSVSLFTVYIFTFYLSTFSTFLLITFCTYWFWHLKIETYLYLYLHFYFYFLFLKLVLLFIFKLVLLKKILLYFLNFYTFDFLFFIFELFTFLLFNFCFLFLKL